MRNPLTLSRQSILRPSLRDLPSRERSMFTKRLTHHFHGSVVDFRSKTEFLMPSFEFTNHNWPDEPENPAHVLRRQQVQRTAHRPRPHYGALLRSHLFDITDSHILGPNPHGQRLGKRVLGLHRRNVSHDIRYAG